MYNIDSGFSTGESFVIPKAIKAPKIKHTTFRKFHLLIVLPTIKLLARLIQDNFLSKT